MNSIINTIEHYQRRIVRSLNDEASLLHCLQKLNKLPINVKSLKKTRVGRTVNDLRKFDGNVGMLATELVGKWKKEVEVNSVRSSGKHERLQHTVERSENINAGILSKLTDSSESSRSETFPEKSRRLERTSKSSCDEKTSNLHHIRVSVERKIDHDLIKNRRQSEKTSDRKRPNDLIDIDSTMGASFADVLVMLDKPSTSRARQLLTRKPSTSSKQKTSEQSNNLEEQTPLLLTKRPRVEPPLDIDVEFLLPSTSEATVRQSRKQTTQMTDEDTILNNIVCRKVKTKIFCGSKTESKVTRLFDMCIRILQDNIDLIEFTGGVPFDILRPVLVRTTYQQLITLEDHNPYLMEDTHHLWEQHCRHRFRSKSRLELESWREMYIRCLDEEQTKLNSLTASIKLSKERQTKPAYDVDACPMNVKKSLAIRVVDKNTSPIDNKIENPTRRKRRKRKKKSNIDPDWTPTTWYRTLYKKPHEPKPPKPPIRKTIDMLRYDRHKAIERKKDEWKREHR